MTTYALVSNSECKQILLVNRKTTGQLLSVKNWMMCENKQTEAAKQEEKKIKIK